jgi:hypothetical protein
VASIVVGQDDYVGQWVSREVGKLWVSGKALGFVEGDKLLAGVTFTNYDGANIWMDCVAIPKSRWLDRRALWCIFHYPFIQLKCTRVTAAIPESNDKSIKLVTSAGFKYEAALERAAPGGESMFIYRMFNEECRWLNRGSK